ncbi:hypothetical protein [Parvularcula lutaonensis]|uniref:Uncharacterized protein n=1 Tax=Parvularcula lutaonensis TaxID=491923 RepID=A0ABV7M934_9PROT|nr:hypothetical protein [Parvularcula lutaonensis]
MKILVIGAAACVAAATGFAQALDWQDDYRSYSAAMEARQWDKARTAAESAWRGSRKALPDGDTKAYLAQNYVELVYQSDMEAAIEPLKDAVRLGELGYGNDNMPVATLQFLLESAEAWLNQRNRGATNRAFEAFSKVDPADAMLPEVVLARMLVARRLLSHNRPEDAASFAGQLSEDLQNARGARSLIVNAEGIRAVAISNTKPLGENGVATSRARVKDPKVGEFLDRVGEGIRAIRRARAVYPI